MDTYGSLNYIGLGKSSPKFGIFFQWVSTQPISPFITIIAMSVQMIVCLNVHRIVIVRRVS